MKNYQEKASIDYSPDRPSGKYMDLCKKTMDLIQNYRILPKKHLGQNFMIDSHYLQLLASYAKIKRSDTVLEVGAGLGFLTRILAQKSKTVLAVEIDTRLVKVLQNELIAFENIKLIEGDILKDPIPPFQKLVSNPPFSISSPLLFWLLGRTFSHATLTLQEDFARRLNAPLGSKDYSRLTVSTYFHFEVELLDNVPRKAFFPLPKVDAVIVQLKHKTPSPFLVKDKGIFNDVVRTLFTQRNRKVRNAILPLFREHGPIDVAAKKKAFRLPFLNKRVRELAPEDFGMLANELSV
ncbi:MAG: ribosomal RNA small subunit methyltransferase A [Candidatus Bathyarchaeota archaeon]|nr:MAG: ribosomal RNA small subunit methyltransferase A [Candidatus Bathyarchaeota archaeon]